MERGPQLEKSISIQETLQNPELVFDSDHKTAETQWRALAERLLNQADHQKRGSVCEYESIEAPHSQLPSIQIKWPISNTPKYSMMLQLNPISEGKGLEQSVFAYAGQYGVAMKNNEKTKFIGREKTVSLEHLFGIPEGIQILVKPTTDRWAIGQDELTLFGNNVFTLYMGLGFLFLGHQWMHIGYHEAGHVPHNYDENLAWTYANRTYSCRHKGERVNILSGAHQGQFDLLSKPSSERRPTIGKIMRFGLTSHALKDNAYIPKLWQVHARSTMNELRSTVLHANQAFDYMIGR